MFYLFLLSSFIECSHDEVEEMFRALEDSNAPILRDSELYRYCMNPDIIFYYDIDDNNLKISCYITYPFVPEELYKLKKLEKLDLSVNYFQALPPSFGNLVNLLTINLRNNLFHQIPDPIFKLKKLRYLDLSFNSIISISDKISLLENLHTLLLPRNSIKNISCYFEICISIKTLDLEGNKNLCRPTSDNPRISAEIILFSKFPNEVERLNLSDTGIHFIPGIFDFPNLLYLDLSNNSIKSLDGVFEKSEKIEILNLDYNEISSFPLKLYQLEHLTSLSMVGNFVTELNFTKNSCKSLVTIILDANPLEKLTMHSSSLAQLSILGLDYTQVQSFVIKDKNTIVNNLHTIIPGRSLIGMKIKHLSICFESLDCIGDLYDLQQLTELFITCYIKKTRTSQHKLLEGLSNLQNLIILSMKNCGLTIFPISLLDLKKLSKIDLSDNFIVEVPKFIKDLSVIEIWLKRNVISKIPVDIFHNPHIEYISLKYNVITILPRNLSKCSDFTGIIDISNNPTIQLGTEYFTGILDIPYTMVENIIIDPIEVNSFELLKDNINTINLKSKYIWKNHSIFTLKTQKIKENTLAWNKILSIFNNLKDKITDTDLQNSTLTYLKKVYQIEEIPKDISIMYGEPQRKMLKNYIEEILLFLLPFVKKKDDTMIENCFILLQNAHDVCFDGQLEHLIAIYKILTDKDWSCLEITISNILVKYKHEGLTLITTSNSYSENVHILSFWRNCFSESCGFENASNLFSVPIENNLLNSGIYIMNQLFKYLEVDKIILKLRNEINENSKLMSEVTGFLFELFEKDLETLKTMVTYNKEIEEFLFTGVTIDGVETILLNYGLIKKRKLERIRRFSV